jgi:hypothetical protein
LIVEWRMESVDEDGMPLPCSSLGVWAFFIYELLGYDSPAFSYMNELCLQFGTDYEIETDPQLFLTHVGLVAFGRDRGKD